MFSWQRTIVVPVLVLVILTLVFPSASPVSATTSNNFSSHTVSTLADFAQSVYAADVDGDGDIDLMSASAHDDKIAWYENTDGDGSTWTEHPVSTAADGAFSIYAADVDGDGDMDLISASWEDNKIAWYENINGDGSAWVADNITTSATSVNSVYAADVDGDGNMDVIYASELGSKVGWYENTAGDGSAWALVVDRAVSNPRSVYAADVDGDGDIDLMSTLATNAIVWFENTNGDGTAFSQHLVNNSLDYPTSVHAADVDGDGDTDLLSASSGDDTIAWYENTAGDGSAWTTANVTTAADGACSVHAADVDGDGDIDLLSASSDDNKIAWYENTAGDGSSWNTHTISTSANNARSVHAADVDGDGDIDLMSASCGDDKIAWYENLTIHRSAYFPQQSVVSTSADGARAVYATDVDGDGDLDLTSASTNDDTIAWYENDGSQNFTAQTVSTSADGAKSVYATDLDGDGDIDLISASAIDNKIAWYENDGSQNFTAHTVSTSADGAESVYAADVDGDGDIDLMSASWGDDKIAWYENDGSQNFTEQSVSTSAWDATAVYAADVDGDGDVDLMSHSILADRISWYENTAGDGSAWTAHVVSLAVLEVYSVYAADVDGDGDIDLMSPSDNLGYTTWYENTAGDGSAWTKHTVSTSADYPDSVYAADVDGDGDIDLMSASPDTDRVAWYENTAGDGTAWTEHNITTSADGAKWVYAADVDGDGDIDLMSASANDDKVAWYENKGGQFALATADTAPANLDQGQTDDLLKITATHKGRSGDADMELATLELLFEESAGDPLTTAEANAIIENLHVYLDDGSDAFESGSDTLMATVADLSLAAGEQTVTFTDGDASVQVAYGTSKTYFVVTELTSDAASQTPDQCRITHLTESSSTAEDRDYDLSLTLEYVANASSSVMAATVPPPPSWGGTPAATGYYLKMDMLGKKLSLLCSSSGEAQQTVTVTSPDGMLTITIPKGTIAKDKSGNGLRTFEVSVNENPPPPPEGANIIGVAYNFGPAGATFAPPITLIFSYDPDALPEGVAEEDLVLAYYDEDAGEWMQLDCVVDTVNHTITAQVSHFTTFAIIGVITLPTPAAFSVSNLSVQPVEVEPGKAVTITISVANTGETEGSYSVVTKINGVKEAEKSVTIADGSSEIVTFSVAREDAGSYTVAVDGLSGSFEVVAPSSPPAPAPKVTVNWPVLGGVTAGVVVAGLLVFLLARRRTY